MNVFTVKGTAGIPILLDSIVPIHTPRGEGTPPPRDGGRLAHPGRADAGAIEGLEAGIHHAKIRGHFSDLNLRAQKGDRIAPHGNGSRAFLSRLGSLFQPGALGCCTTKNKQEWNP